MTRMRQTHVRGCAILGAVAVPLLLAMACSEPPFAHTNPIDPLYEGTMTLTGGPDTIRTTQVNFTLTLTGDPALDPAKHVSWSSNHARLITGGGATFWAHPTLMPTTAIARATIGSTIAERSFVLLQEVGELTARCTTTSPCDTVDALGQTFEFDLVGEDTYGLPLRDVQHAISHGSVAPRNPTLFESAASQIDARVRFVSRANGTTWLLLGLGGHLDSVRVVVAQRAVTWTNHCPVTVEVGQTLHLGASDYMDRLLQPLAADHPAPQLTWLSGGAIDAGAQAVVDPTGQVTGVAPGRWLTASRAPGVQPDIACVVEVIDP
jgi:hypothetical protein